MKTEVHSFPASDPPERRLETKGGRGVVFHPSAPRVRQGSAAVPQASGPQGQLKFWVSNPVPRPPGFLVTTRAGFGLQRPLEALPLSPLPQFWFL